MNYVDAHGKTLADYDRPSVAVDTALLTLPTDGQLSVVLVKDSAAGDWRLPGTFLHVGETLAAAVQRSLKVKAGVSGRSPTQLYVFDAPKRDDRGWVLSVAHLDAVPFADLAIDRGLARLTPIAEVGQLRYDHEEIIRLAVARLRERYADHPDPEGFAGSRFTLLELQRVHEAVHGTPLMRDTFRRVMQPQLVETGDFGRGLVGKPASLFRKRARTGARGNAPRAIGRRRSGGRHGSRTSRDVSRRQVRPRPQLAGPHRLAAPRQSKWAGGPVRTFHRIPFVRSPDRPQESPRRQAPLARRRGLD